MIIALFKWSLKFVQWLWFSLFVKLSLLLPVWKSCHIALTLQVHKYSLKIGKGYL